jgi:hypothetical protein
MQGHALEKGGVMSGNHKTGWNPYLSGAFTGLVIVFSVWLSGNFFGTSTTFVRTAGMLESLVTPERVATMPYFIKELPRIDWQWMFVMGIFLGSLLAAKLFGDFHWQAVPLMWEKRFGLSQGKRALVAFVGGALAMFGARLADG